MAHLRLLIGVFGTASAYQAKMIGFDLHHSSHFTGVSPYESLSRRDVSASLDNEFSWYGIELAVGTPPQATVLQIDTGSSDMWLSSTFNSAQSSTYHANLTDPFQITYGDGTGASGTYAQDTVTIVGGLGGAGNNVTLHNVNFGYAPSATTSPQVCGIGMPANEVAGHSYSNLPMQLKEQGLISAAVYAMRLGSYNSPGQLLFGGVDHSQYDGQLQTVPIVSTSQFLVELDGIYFGNQTVYNQKLNVLLDSGTTNLLLPTDMANAIVQAMEPSLSLGTSLGNTGYAVDCSAITDDKYFELEFSGARMRMPFKNVVDPSSLTKAGEVPSSGTCGLAIQTSTSSSRVILGDRFLTGVYVVYDLENRQIALANVKSSSPITRNNAASSDVEIVHRGIPGASQAPLYNASQTIQSSQSSATGAAGTTSMANAAEATANTASSTASALKVTTSAGISEVKNSASQLKNTPWLMALGLLL